MSPVELRRPLAERVYYGWVVAVACLFASMAVFGTSYSFGVFFDDFLDAFGASRAGVSAVFGVQTFVLYVGSIAAGRFVDRRGQRVGVVLGGALLVCGLLATAASRSYVELLVAFGVLTALGMAHLYVVAYATVPLWFDRRRGTAAGLASSGLGVGLVVIPPATNRLLATVGWRRALVLLAAVLAVVTALVALFFADEPSDVGADASVEFGEGDRGATTDEGAGRARGDDGGTAGAPTELSLRAVLTPEFLLVFVGWTLLFAPLYVLFSHVVLYAADAGLGRGLGVFAITVVGLTTTATRLGIGPVADRLGRTRVFVGSTGCMGLAVAALVLAPSPSLFLATVAVFGVAYGGGGALLGPVVADLFGNGGLNTRFAAMSVSFAISGLLAPPAAGYVYDRLGTYEPVFVSLGAVGLLGAACVVVAARSLEPASGEGV